MKFGDRAARLVAAMLMVGLFASSRVARAADADELIRQGVSLRRNGDDVGALKRFEQAFQLDHGSRALAQIGLAEQALGRWSVAYEHLRQALEDTRDPWIGKSRAALRQALDVVSDHVGQLEVLGGSPGAEVRIDGASRGKLPLARAIPVSAGTVTIELWAPKFVPVQRTTVVRARQTVRESFDALVPVLLGSGPTQSAAAGSTEATAIPLPPAEGAKTLAASEAQPIADASQKSGPAVERESVDRTGPSSFRPKLKWIAWGAGAAALAVGIVGMVRQDQAGDDFDHGCAVGAGQVVMPLPGSTRTASDCSGFKARVDSNYRLELIGYVTVGALAATGLVLWLTEPATVGGKTVGWACSPGATARGPSLGCALAF